MTIRCFGKHLFLNEINLDTLDKLKALAPTVRMELPRLRMLQNWLEQHLKRVPDLGNELPAR